MVSPSLNHKYRCTRIAPKWPTTVTTSNEPPSEQILTGSNESCSLVTNCSFLIIFLDCKDQKHELGDFSLANHC